MKTIEPTTDQVQADLEEVCRLLTEGKRVSDSALSRRIADRAEEARTDALRLIGIQNSSVEIVRELRDPQ